MAAVEEPASMDLDTPSNSNQNEEWTEEEMTFMRAALEQVKAGVGCLQKANGDPPLRAARCAAAAAAAAPPPPLRYAGRPRSAPPYLPPRCTT